MRLSFSQLHTYQACPRQYEFASVKKIPRGISAGESFGSSVHNTLKKWGEMEMSGQQSAGSTQLGLFQEEQPADSLQFTADCLLALWHSSFIVEGYESRADAEAARKRGERVMQHYFEWWQREVRTVVSIESGFKLPIDDMVVSGRFDRIEEHADGLLVIDYKSSAPRTQEEVDNDLQLSIYALASEQVFQKPCAELLLLFLREDGVTERRTVRTAEQLTHAQEVIRRVSGSIQERLFDPAPGTVCARCPYRTICDAAV